MQHAATSEKACRKRPTSLGRAVCLLAIACLLLAAMGGRSSAAEKVIRAGVAKVDITPEKLPILVNGWVLERTANRIRDRLHARVIVFESDGRRMAMAVVDNLMMDVYMLDEAKAMASVRSGIPVDRMMVSADHIHSAPSASGCLGTPIDQDYRKFLIGKIDGRRSQESGVRRKRDPS